MTPAQPGSEMELLRRTYEGTAFCSDHSLVWDLVKQLAPTFAGNERVIEVAESLAAAYLKRRQEVQEA